MKAPLLVVLTQPWSRYSGGGAIPLPTRGRNISRVDSPMPTSTGPGSSIWTKAPGAVSMMSCSFKATPSASAWRVVWRISVAPPSTMPTMLAGCAHAGGDASKLATHSRSNLNEIFVSRKTYSLPPAGMTEPGYQPMRQRRLLSRAVLFGTAQAI
ncbi:hypothetical protein APY03_7417 [Variovorax sp. WDL1]|nr:hypothetical protein APY03_7417 [Variovorax sp. WDL1]